MCGKLIVFITKLHTSPPYFIKSTIPRYQICAYFTTTITSCLRHALWIRKTDDIDITILTSWLTKVEPTLRNASLESRVLVPALQLPVRIEVDHVATHTENHCEPDHESQRRIRPRHGDFRSVSYISTHEQMVCCQL